MAGQPEKRSTLGHLLNVSMPFDKVNPVWRLICKGVSELEEEFNPDTDEQQYICEDVKTTILKTYAPSFEISMGYQKDELIQYYFDVMSRRLPTGEKTNIEYIRFNKNETMFGTSTQFIGVRWNANIRFESIGGAGDDYLTSAMTVSATGSPEVGYVNVEDTGNGPNYTWVPANVEVPFVTSFTYTDSSSQEQTLTMNKYYTGYPIYGSSFVIKGKGVAEHTIEFKGENGSGLSANDEPVDASGNWQMTVNIGGNAYGLKNFAFIQKKTASPTNKSVTTKMYTFKLPDAPHGSVVPTPMVKQINGKDAETIDPGNTETITDNQFTISGAGHTGYKISLYNLSEGLIPPEGNEVTVDAQGDWEMTISVKPGTPVSVQHFSVIQKSTDGTKSSSPTKLYEIKLEYTA